LSAKLPSSSSGRHRVLYHRHACAGSAVQSAVEELAQLSGQQQQQRGGSSSGAPAGGGLVRGIGCNMARPAEVAALADYAQEELGTVDLWIK
jgi:NAD(P)-dependent dehydrogenase (short-subunit alcohol dehydrogenase family)